MPILALANSLPFNCTETNPDFRCIRVLNKLWAKTYLHGSYFFEDNKNRIPAMQFKFQKNDNLELLFKHGNVQFIKVLMSAQYYAKENLAIIVVRIHSDTYNQFKELIKTLREAYKKVDGEWVLRAKTPLEIGTEMHQDLEEALKVKDRQGDTTESVDVDQLLKESQLRALANDIIDGCLSDDSES